MTETIIDTTATEVPATDPIAARLAPIYAALTADADADDKRAALDPLRAIYAEICAGLDGAPAPRMAPPAPAPSPLRGVSVDQALDLVIAQLRAAVGERGAVGADPLAQLLGSLR